MNLKSESWAALAVAGAAQFLVLLESTVITIAIPPIAAELGDRGLLSWVLTGYLLAFGGFLLPGGAWADRLGQGRTFLCGLVGFAMTSALCALSDSLTLLVIARISQGATAGILAASALGVVLARYTGERERAIAMTVWSTLGVIGAVIGSLAAGPVISWLGWPGVFWINVAAVAALLCFSRAIHANDRASSNSHDTNSSQPRVTPVLLGASGAAAVLMGLSLTEGTVILGAAVAIAGSFVIVVVIRQQRRTQRPVLPVQLFSLRSYRSAATGLFLTNGLMIAAMFAYSRHLQESFHLSAQAASLAILPMALASLVIAFLVDPMIGRFAQPAVFRAGATLLLIGSAGMLVVSLFALDWTLLLVSGALLGAGLPACFVVLNRQAFKSVNPSRSGAASGFTNTITTLGGAALIAVTALGFTLTGQTGAYAVLALTAAVILLLAVTSRSR